MMRCLFASASPAAKAGQAVEMTVRIDTQIMSATRTTVLAAWNARISRFSDTILFRQGTIASDAAGATMHGLPRTEDF